MTNFIKKITDKTKATSSNCCSVEIKEVIEQQTEQQDSCCGTSGSNDSCCG